MTDLAAIDGSHGEGGGQILRTSLALSAITGRAARIFNIRSKRAKPGLQPQHLVAVKSAAAICGADVRGAVFGSREITFSPGPVRPGEYRFEIGTAGSTGLVLQTLYLPLLLGTGSPSSVTVTGGTHVPFSPSFHYLSLQWRPFLERIGLHVSLQMESAGYYPRGGGSVTAAIQPSAGVRPLVIGGRGALRRIRGVSAVTGLPLSIAERQRNQALKRMGAADCPCDIEIADIKGVGQGTMLLLIAEFERSQACYQCLGTRGKRAEQVADDAADQMLHLIQGEGDIDEHLADQIILPLAMSEGGESSFVTPKLNMHLLTNIEIIRQFLPLEIEMEGIGGNTEIGRPALVKLLPAR